jgi:hypothetical protein
VDILIHFVVNADRNDPECTNTGAGWQGGSERFFRPLSVRENRTVPTALDNFIPLYPALTRWANELRRSAAANLAVPNVTRSYTPFR